MPASSVQSLSTELDTDNDNWFHHPRTPRGLRIPGRPVGEAVVRGNPTTHVDRYSLSNAFPKEIRDRDSESCHPRTWGRTSLSIRRHRCSIRREGSKRPML